MTLRRKTTFSWSQKHAAANPDIAAALARPQVRDILDTIDAHRAALFVVRCPPQVFKTLLGQLRLMRSLQVEPRKSLWYRESIDVVRAFAIEKLNPLFDSLAPLPPLLFADRNRRTTLHYSFPDGSYLALLSAGVLGNRQSKTACDIYLDEPWLYEPGWIGQIQKRHDSYPHDYREIDMTTGATAGTEADARYAASDQRTWHTRCPACHKLFFPGRTIKDPATGEFLGGLVYDTVLTDDGQPNKAAIAASTAYQCPRCRIRLPNTDATRLALSGTAAQPRGLYVALNAAAAPRTFGWHINHIALKDWAPLAIKMVEADIARTRLGDLGPTEELVRLYDAATWDPEKYHRPQTAARYQHVTPVYEIDLAGQRTPKLDDTGKPLVAATPYLMEEPWADALLANDGKPFRFATVDVQLDHFFLVIRTWGRFSQSRLWFTAKCLSFAEVAVHCARAEVPPQRTFLDSRHDTQRTRTIAARTGCITLMGDKAMRDYLHLADQSGMRRIYAEEKIIDALTGTQLQGRTDSACVEFLFSKNAALDRLSLLRSPESVHPLDGTPLWTAAANAPEWYFTQINAHYRKRVEEKDGEHHHVWMGQKDDHAADCEAMQIVAATMANLTGAESLPVKTSTEKN